MKHFRVQFSPDAKNDLIQAARYIAQNEQSPNVALAWYQKIHDSIMSLQTMPHRCPFARENEAFDEEVRQLVHQSYRVIFTIHHKTKTVLIHRIWHSARNLATQNDLTNLNPENE